MDLELDATTAAPAAPAAPRLLRRVLVHSVLSVNLLVQLSLAVLGAGLLGTADGQTTVALLDLWSLIALLYLAAVAIAVTRVARPPRTRPVATVPRFYVSWAAHLIGALSTVIASVCGIAGTVQVIVVYGEVGSDLVADIVGTAAMLLSWAMLHWGFAQFYHRRHVRSPGPVVAFPGGAPPRLSDFVYFAFTVGTSFATSDAEILSPSLRWTVTQHSVLSFFYNGAIIVLALNTLTAQARP